MKQLKYEDLKKGMKVRVKSYKRCPFGWCSSMMEYCGRTVTISNKSDGSIQLKENTDWRMYGEKWAFLPQNFIMANVWQGEPR